MSKRRGKINVQSFETSYDLPAQVEGGDDFIKCMNYFVEDLELKNLSYHTRRWHRENLDSVYKTLQLLNLATQPVQITDKTIKECVLYWRREKNLSPTTVNHRIRSLRQLFVFLNKEGIVNHFPIKAIEDLKAPKTIIKPFEKDELRKLFAQPDKSTFVGFRDYTIMLVFLDTGVRLIEMIGMKATDIDLRNNRILVLGKGAKEREVVFQATTKEYLRRYLLLRGELDHDYLWVTDTNTPMKRRNFGERLTIYGKMAGLTGVRVSPHTFRHTCAKQYIKKGGDILSLQKLLGHSTLEMVRHYVNLWGSDLQQMHKQFSPVEGLFG